MWKRTGGTTFAAAGAYIAKELQWKTPAQPGPGKGPATQPGKSPSAAMKKKKKQQRMKANKMKMKAKEALLKAKELPELKEVPGPPAESDL